MKICTLEGCETPIHAKGLCSRHYQRKSDTGSPTGTRRKPTSELFWRKVDKSGDCWTWKAAKLPSGYGQIRVEGSLVSAHRLSYEMTNGAIPEGFLIDHMCHNKSCVKPGHLRAVTQKQNQENRAGADSNSSSGVRGVSWEPRRKHWRGHVLHHGRQHHVGSFSTIEEAAAAVAAKRNELFTHNDKDRNAA